MCLDDTKAVMHELHVRIDRKDHMVVGFVAGNFVSGQWIGQDQTSWGLWPCCSPSVVCPAAWRQLAGSSTCCGWFSPSCASGSCAGTRPVQASRRVYLRVGSPSAPITARSVRRRSDAVHRAHRIQSGAGETQTSICLKATRQPRPRSLCFARYRRREKRTWPTRYLNLYDQPPSPDLTHSLVFISTSRQLCLRDSIHMRGASEGSKPVHIMPREVLDLRQVSDWVVKQACATLV